MVDKSFFKMNIFFVFILVLAKGDRFKKKKKNKKNLMTDIVAFNPSFFSNIYLYLFKRLNNIKKYLRAIYSFITFISTN